MAKKVLLTDRKIAELRRRMANHTVQNGKAIVELTARELQSLLDAVEPQPKKYKRDMIPRPDGTGMDYLYSVTLVVAHEGIHDPEDITKRVAGACLLHPSHPMIVVDGYGMKGRNLTLADPKNRCNTNGMTPIGFAKKDIPKKLQEVPVLRVAGIHE